MSAPPPKRQKREQYRKKAAAAAGNETQGKVKLPQKKFYRQRAHANPFSDHQLD
jgi:tRNA (guanine-N7-)-methyltransferase